MSFQYEAISQVGERIRSYRIGKGLSPDDVARETGISRAAIYRYEAGQPIRVDALGKIADLLDISLASLFGVGSEYVSSAVTFFERMKQLEATSDQINVMFGPVSYLLTTSEFDDILGQVLLESVPNTAAERINLETDTDQILKTLKERKANFQRRKPNIVSLVSSAELGQFVRTGFVGGPDISGAALKARKKAARKEVEHIIELLSQQPIGIQIGVVEDSMPSSSFQIFRSGTRAQVAVSPFRLGAFPNTRIGVATITSAQESVMLHQDVTELLWKNSLKGNDAINRLSAILAN